MGVPSYLTQKFNDLKALHYYLKDNNNDIIASKKSSVFKSIDKGAGVCFTDFSKNTNNHAEKASALGFKNEHIYPVINSTQWLDSHFDVHLKGCYKKTVKEQQGRVYLIDTHLKGISNIITRKDYIKMMVKEVDWRSLGKDIDGTTESLVFEIPEINVRPDALDFIKSTPDLENSFAMRYLNISVAIKSNDPSFKEENELWEENIGNIANSDVAKKYGFFYAVKELAIVGEGSICPVVGGSNSATRTLNVSLEEPSNHSEKDKEPTKEVTQEKKVSFIKLK